MSNDDKRINRNASQISNQIARHDTDAARNIVFAILGVSLVDVRNVCFLLHLGDLRGCSVSWQ
jgi:hypothetical protein